jgi:hypothetical protein
MAAVAAGRLPSHSRPATAPAAIATAGSSPIAGMGAHHATQTAPCGRRLRNDLQWGIAEIAVCSGFPRSNFFTDRRVRYRHVFAHRDPRSATTSVRDAWMATPELSFCAMPGDRAALHWPRLIAAVLTTSMTASTGHEPSGATHDDQVLHELKNHLSVILGFCELLLRELPEGDPKRPDILEMHKASNAAVALLPALFTRVR